MDIVREIVKLINYSPKRKHLFSEKLLQSNGPKCGIKPLCPTCWTVRTEAIDAVIKQYTVILETMEEVHRTTRDEYGLKAGGILAALDKFEMFCHDVKVPPPKWFCRPKTAENGCRIGSAVVTKSLSSPNICCCGRS